MRVVPMLLFLALAVPAMAADRAVVPGATLPAPKCPQTTTYLANTHGLYRGAPLAPKKLTELPPAKAYMAVDRKIGGCEAPLTMVEYRGVHRR